MTLNRFIIVALLALGALTTRAAAQPTVDWFTVDGGGAMFSSGGDFTVSGTIGQHDAGQHTGGVFGCDGGFWYVGIQDPKESCDGDVNCDGAINGFDIEVMEQAINGDLSNFCQEEVDFNHDGAENGFDVEAVEQVVNGAPCP